MSIAKKTKNTRTQKRQPKHSGGRQKGSRVINGRYYSPEQARSLERAQEARKRTIAQRQAMQEAKRVLLKAALAPRLLPPWEWEPSNAQRAYWQVGV